jgi:hypothetical protein
VAAADWRGKVAAADWRGKVAAAPIGRKEEGGGIDLPTGPNEGDLGPKRNSCL